jgi:hypothetical protein
MIALPIKAARACPAAAELVASRTVFAVENCGRLVEP